jgi:hypothetical protein
LAIALSIPQPPTGSVILLAQNHTPSALSTRESGFLCLLTPNFLWDSFSPLYLLGYIPAHNRVYLGDKDMNIYGYALSLSVVEYQTAVLRGDMAAAAEILPTMPKDQLNKVARFLEGRGLCILTLN